MNHLGSLPGATLTHLSCSRCFFGFPRQELSFGFLPSSLTFCFFFNAYSRTFECGVVVEGLNVITVLNVIKS